MKKENNKITYRGYIVPNDKKIKTNFAALTGYDDIFIQPYNSEYHIKIEKIIIEK